MPSFEFTSPDGKSYTVEGPEGATEAQAFDVLQQQIASGTAHETGAKTGGSQPTAGTKAPNMQSPQMSASQGAQPQERGPGQDPQTLAQSAGEVGKATAIGGLAGLAAPELMIGAGMALEATGVGAPLGAPLIAGGMVLRSARLASAGIGALQSAISSTAGQVARAQGATPGEQTGVELGVGLGAGVAGKAIANTIGYVAGGPLKTIVSAVQRFANGGEMPVGKAVKLAQENLSKAGSATAPQVDFHAMLSQGVAADIQASNKAADDVIRAAQQHADRIAATDAEAAKRIMDDARTRASQIQSEARTRARVLDAATDGKLKTAQQVQKAADSYLTGVGQPKEISDIGNDIRQSVTQKQGGLVEARNKAYQDAVKQRDAIVAEKEAAGNTITNQPELKQLQKDIDRLTLDTKAGQKAAGGRAEVTDQAQLRDLRNVREAISNRRVQTGVDEAGNPTYQTFKTTFGALDDIRRRIGEKLGGQAAEGYSAIAQGRAQELYARLSDIQNKYVGGDIQKTLQQRYAAETGDIAKFKEGTGKAVTAMNRLQPDTFVKDPATLPGAFFKSQQSYRDLRELTSPEKATQLAQQYVAKNLQGKSSQQATSWLRSQSDWLREEPGIAMSADTYVRKLQQTERVADKLGKRATGYQSSKEQTLAAGAKESAAEVEGATKRASAAAEGSVKTQQEVRVAGEKEAAGIRKAAGERAEVLRKGNFPAEATRKLLTTGSPEEISYATKALAGMPGGKKAIEGSVRGVLRDANPRNIGQLWDERIGPMLRDGNLLPKSEYMKLEADVKRVIAAADGGGKPKVGAVAALVRSALVSGTVTSHTRKGE